MGPVKISRPVNPDPLRSLRGPRGSGRVMVTE
nr:MAG TPA: hypothetical protein [Caudoviricetes sp.]